MLSCCVFDAASVEQNLQRSERAARRSPEDLGVFSDRPPAAEDDNTAPADDMDIDYPPEGSDDSYNFSVGEVARTGVCTYKD